MTEDLKQQAAERLAGRIRGRRADGSQPSIARCLASDAGFSAAVEQADRIERLHDLLEQAVRGWQGRMPNPDIVRWHPSDTAEQKHSEKILREADQLCSASRKASALLVSGKENDGT